MEIWRFFYVTTSLMWRVQWRSELILTLNLHLWRRVCLLSRHSIVTSEQKTGCTDVIFFVVNVKTSLEFSIALCWSNDGQSYHQLFVAYQINRSPICGSRRFFSYFSEKSWSLLIGSAWKKWSNSLNWRSTSRYCRSDQAIYRQGQTLASTGAFAASRFTGT
jgi:hypothetical protein